MRRTFGVLLALLLLAGCGGQPGPIPPSVSLPSPAGPGSMAPHLAVTPGGVAVLSWLEPIGAKDSDGGSAEYALKFSRLEGDNWSDPVVIATGNDWFVNYADIPSVVPLSETQWAAHWLVKRPGGTYSYDIALVTSANAGRNWSEPMVPHRDGTPTEHGFVSLFPWQGDVGAVWLDGREMAPDAAVAKPVGDRKYGGMTLRDARIGFDGSIRQEHLIDELVCDCCMTDVAVAADGPVVVYRNRTEDEIRDIAVARYVDGKWTGPVIVSDDHWKIPGCPVNGPAIAADGEQVVVAWYGAPKRKRRVKLAWSEDGGRSFSAPVIVDEGPARGRVDIVLADDGVATVSWVAKISDETGQMRVREASSDGLLGPVQVVFESSMSRNSGFPQMVLAAGRLVYAWPEPGQPKQILLGWSPAN